MSMDIAFRHSWIWIWIWIGNFISTASLQILLRLSSFVIELCSETIRKLRDTASEYHLNLTRLPKVFEVRWTQFKCDL